MTSVDPRGVSTEERLEKRLKGFARIPRGIFLSLPSKALNPSELTLWLFSAIVLADWDDKHSSVYGTFDYSFQEIGDFLGLNRTTIHKQATRLFELGYWTKRPKDSRIIVVGFEQLSQLGKLTEKYGIISIDDMVAISRHSDDSKPQSVENAQPAHPKGFTGATQGDVENNHADSSKLYVSSKGKGLEDDEYLIRSYDITTNEKFTIDIRDFDKWNAERRRSAELNVSSGGESND